VRKVSAFFLLPLMLAAGLLAGCAQMPSVSRDTPVVAEQADLQRRTEIRMSLASAYYDAAQYSSALQEVGRALQISPQRADLHGLRALILMQMGQQPEAEQSLQQALRLDPDNPDIQNNAGWFYCQSGRSVVAMPYFERAIASRSYVTPAKAMVNAGLCSLRAGDTPRAERYLLRALEAEPRNVLAHASLAKIFYKRADYRHAHQHILLAVNGEAMAADHLLMAIRIEQKLGDRNAEQSLASQLRRLFPDSPQLIAYLRGESDE
jgi:type IV pilus assembly protein PilF